MKWNTNGRIAEAALLALSIVVLGLCIRWGIDDFANKDRKVTVKGLAEKEVDADKVTWPILSKELGNSLPDLYDRIERTQDKIKRFLTDNGIKENEIDVNAPVVYRFVQTAEEAEEGFAALDDKVYGVLLETALQRVRLVALKNRGIAGETEVPLPDGWNAAKVNVYCFVMSGNERMVSDSIFLPVSTQA